MRVLGGLFLIIHVILNISIPVDRSSMDVMTKVVPIGTLSPKHSKKHFKNTPVSCCRELRGANSIKNRFFNLVLSISLRKKN